MFLQTAVELWFYSKYYHSFSEASPLTHGKNNDKNIGLLVKCVNHIMKIRALSDRHLVWWPIPFRHLHWNVSRTTSLEVSFIISILFTAPFYLSAFLISIFNNQLNNEKKNVRPRLVFFLNDMCIEPQGDSRLQLYRPISRITDWQTKITLYR